MSTNYYTVRGRHIGKRSSIGFEKCQFIFNINEDMTVREFKKLISPLESVDTVITDDDGTVRNKRVFLNMIQDDKISFNTGEFC